MEQQRREKAEKFNALLEEQAKRNSDKLQELADN